MSSQKFSQKSDASVAVKKTTKRLMIDTNDFKITNWSVTEIDFEDEKTAKANQFTCYGRYNYGKESSPVLNQLVFKTSPIKLTSYGIPSLGQYAKTDKDRSYVKIPFDKSQQSCVELFKMFEALDTWAIKNKEKFFTGKLAKAIKFYDYTPIVRKAQEVVSLEDDDEAESKPKSERPMYAKIKISTEWPSGDVNTSVFVRENGIPVKQEVTTVTDMAQHVMWQSTIQMICSCNKLWFGKSADKSGRRQYGLAFKILQCEVTEKANNNGIKNDFSTYAFDDSIDIEEKVSVSKKKDMSDSEDNSDSDSEDNKPTNTDNKNKESSDEDSESENDKPTNIVNKNKESSDDDDSDSNSDSESDSSSDDEKPIKKKLTDEKNSRKKPTEKTSVKNTR